MSDFRHDCVHDRMDRALELWMSVFVVKSRMDHHEVHVAPPPVHVDPVHELEPIVGQSGAQGTGDAVSQRLRCHTLNTETRTIAGKECHKSPPRPVWSNEQLGLLSAPPQRWAATPAP